MYDAQTSDAQHECMGNRSIAFARVGSGAARLMPYQDCKELIDLGRYQAKSRGEEGLADA